MIRLTSTDANDPAYYRYSLFRDSSQIMALTELIYCESRGEPFEGKAMVGMVAINESILHNKPIADVVNNTRRYDGARHFSKSRKINREYIESYAAAKYSFYNHTLPLSVLYFYNPKTSTDYKFIKSISNHIYMRIGNHIFCHDPDVLCSLTTDF